MPRGDRGYDRKLERRWYAVDTRMTRLVMATSARDVLRRALLASAVSAKKLSQEDTVVPPFSRDSVSGTTLPGAVSDCERNRQTLDRDRRKPTKVIVKVEE